MESSRIYPCTGYLIRKFYNLATTPQAHAIVHDSTGPGFLILLMINSCFDDLQALAMGYVCMQLLSYYMHVIVIHCNM